MFMLRHGKPAFRLHFLFYHYKLITTVCCHGDGCNSSHKCLIICTVMWGVMFWTCLSCWVIDIVEDKLRAQAHRTREIYNQVDSLQSLSPIKSSRRCYKFLAASGFYKAQNINHEGRGKVCLKGKEWCHFRKHIFLATGAFPKAQLWH